MEGAQSSPPERDSVGDRPKVLIAPSPKRCFETFDGRSAIARSLRCLSAPHGLLGRDDAGPDCYLVAADGWKAETRRILEEVKTGKKKGEMKDKGWTCDLIPKPYIVARYFAEEQSRIDELQGQLDEVSANMDELLEEHGGEEGILKDVSSKNDAIEAYTSALTAVWNEDDKHHAAALVR